MARQFQLFQLYLIQESRLREPALLDVSYNTNNACILIKEGRE
jgi:hypothetical protein